MVVSDVLEGEPAVSQDAAEDVVEVVRDPTGEGADRLHLLRLVELLTELRLLCLGAALLGEALEDAHQAPLTKDAVGHRGARQTDREHVAGSGYHLADIAQI